jgi:hypothetical protein
MSIWIGAKEAAADAANAMRRQQGMMKQGDFQGREPLEQIVETLRSAAAELAEYPDTTDYVETINEIAFRWDKGGATPEQLAKDLRATMLIEKEMFSRMIRESRGEKPILYVGPSLRPRPSGSGPGRCPDRLQQVAGYFHGIGPHGDQLLRRLLQMPHALRVRVALSRCQFGCHCFSSGDLSDQDRPPDGRSVASGGALWRTPPKMPWYVP